MNKSPIYKSPILRLCGVFLILNFLILLPMGWLPGVFIIWGISGLPAALHCCLWSRSAACRSDICQKRLLLCCMLLGLILIANILCIIMQQIQPDAFFLIAAAMVGGITGLFHIILTAVMMLAARPCGGGKKH